MSAQTIGRDHVEGPVGIAGGRPRFGGCGGCGWRLTANMLEVAVSLGTSGSIRVLDRTHR